MNAPTLPLLSVDNLSLTYAGGNHAVRGVSFALQPGECLALVGESGCGKTSIARAVIGLLPRSTNTSGHIRFGGEDLLAAPERRLQHLRGLSIGYVAQDPFEACDPLTTIGGHLAESWKAHGLPVPRDEAAAQLSAIGITNAARRLRQYPHQWSGGMLQRAAIAAATAHRPPLIVADEPTSALDADHADLTLNLLRAAGTAVLLVSHDLDLVARHADRIAVCYAGQIVEIGTAEQVGLNPRHPYTRRLSLALPRSRGVLPLPLPGSPPRLDQPIEGCAFAPRCSSAEPQCRTQAPPPAAVACWHPPQASAPARALASPRLTQPRDETIVVKGQALARRYGLFEALSHADLSVCRGEIVGIGGPSGGGKSTLLRLLGTIEAPSAGTLSFGFPTRRKRMAGGRLVDQAAPGMVMPVFQDPSGSLDPRWPIWRSLTEPHTLGRWPFNRTAQKQSARQHLETVGLGHLDIEARPSELSLGQCQRIAIARAIAARPALVIADEPTSALDAAATATVVGLLDALAANGTAIVMVSHDRKLLDSLCDRVLTMHDGRLYPDGSNALAGAAALTAS
ncbi:MAG TPA: oligopeptide/dipeptide ABC transporter ATP-binding protein [Pelagibacterium sp.]|uniref:oligopeptide/dipeptide ABC transporter ATP-binding protein n=1 Tax=Pelagibacterium sp. TaxID=1967288 RepID=UPI002C17C2DA|nr:oligopeptide/dipeptide ABC transporter ATP-binding protein [Pelagibacterium sp.]HWJ86754.1 oligopeptide/dipeptide ABC transporter ATP-binding protein [Pelagibacterium sp.]